MPTILDEIAVQLRLEATQYGRGLSQAASQTRQFNTSMTQSTRSAGQFGRQASTAAGSVAAFGGAVGAAVLTSQYFAAVIDQGTENLRRMATFIFNTNREFQRLDASLRTALGSAVAARGAFKLIEDFARETPFEVNNLTAAFVKLSQFGFVPLRSELEGLGNIAASQSRDITDLGAAIVSAVNTSVEPIREFGVQAKISGDQMIVSFGGVTETIDRSIPALAEFLAQQGQIGDRAAAMSNRMATLDGAISNVSDSAGEFARRIGAGGLNKELVESIRSFDDLIQRSDALADAIGVGAAAAVDKLTGALERLVPIASAVSGLLQKIGVYTPASDAFRALQDAEGKATSAIRGMESLADVTRLQGELNTAIGSRLNIFSTSSADRQALPLLYAQMEAANEQAALLQARVDAGARTFTGFGSSAAAAADEVQKIREALAEGRREISAMEAATAGTSIEFDAARESAALLENAIRQLASTGREDALAMLPALVAEWQAYEQAIAAAEAATQRQKDAIEQLALSQEIAAENARKHHEAVAEFKSRQFEMSRDLAEQELEFNRNVAEGIAASFTDAFNEMIQGTKSVGEAFRDMASSIIADIQRILIQKSIIEPIVNALFPAAGTDFLNSLKDGTGRIDLGGPGGGLPHFARGGDIRAGQAAVIGEEGPEIFIPASAGRIVPNGAVAGGVTEIVEIHAPMNFNFPGVNASEATQLARQMAPEMSVLVVREVERRFALRRKVTRR